MNSFFLPMSCFVLQNFNSFKWGSCVSIERNQNNWIHIDRVFFWLQLFDPLNLDFSVRVKRFGLTLFSSNVFQTSPIPPPPPPPPPIIDQLSHESDICFDFDHISAMSNSDLEFEKSLKKSYDLVWPFVK